MIIDGIRYCNVCYKEIPTGLGHKRRIVYCSDKCRHDAVKRPKSEKTVPEYEDSFINIGSQDIWILNSRFIKYLNKNQEEEIQKFIFEDLSLLA